MVNFTLCVFYHSFKNWGKGETTVTPVKGKCAHPYYAPSTHTHTPIPTHRHLIHLRKKQTSSFHKHLSIFFFPGAVLALRIQQKIWQTRLQLHILYIPAEMYKSIKTIISQIITSFQVLTSAVKKIKQVKELRLEGFHFKQCQKD